MSITDYEATRLFVTAEEEDAERDAILHDALQDDTENPFVYVAPFDNQLRDADPELLAMLPTPAERLEQAREADRRLIEDVRALLNEARPLPYKRVEVTK